MSLYNSIAKDTQTNIQSGSLNNTLKTSSIPLSSTSGFLFKVGDYVVVWNAGVYAKPDNDPNVRVGLLTARTVNSLTVEWGKFATSIAAIPGTLAVASLFSDYTDQDITSPLESIIVNGSGLNGTTMNPVSRKPGYRVATFTQNFQIGHGWTAGGGGLGSSNLNDTSTFSKGTQSATVTTNGTGVQTQLRRTAGPSLDLTGKAMRFTFKVSDVSHLNRIEFIVASSSFSNFFKWTIHTHSNTNPNWVYSGEWCVMTISWADVLSASGTYSISSTGVPSVKSGFTDVQMAIYDDAVAPVSLSLQSFEVIPDTTPVFPNGVVSITFDDSFKSVDTYARPAMDVYGYRGTLYNIIGSLDTDAAHLTTNDLNRFQNTSGWEIGAHAYNAIDHTLTFAGMSSSQVAEDMRNTRAWLVSHGFSSESLAYPQGQFGLTTDGVMIDTIAARYFATSRTTISENKETFAPANPQRLRGITGINDGSGLGGVTVTSLTSTGGPLDRCQLDGNWLILTFHKIVTGTPADAVEISQTGFQTVMAAINSRGIPVLPVGEVINNYS